MNVTRRRWTRVALFTLLALAAVVYFVDLGGSSIWDANEAFYVETPREMLAAHDFINPTFNFLPRLNKPVLSYWIVAGFYKLFGVSVAVQRIPIALGAMLLIACACILARLCAPNPEPRTPNPGRRTTDDGRRISAALWAALGVAVDPRLVMFARRIFIDIWISAFLALTLTFFALSERHPDRRRLYLLLMYVSVGLGVLTKGPVAIALPGLAFALYLVSRGELRRVTQMMIPAGIVIVAVIVVPWYAALYHQHGWAQIRSFLLTENVERFTSGEGVRQARGYLFYLPVLFSDSFPWSLLLVPAAVLWFERRDRIEALLWCWIIAIVGFFSFSAGKQDLYIFPIVPAVAALGGAVLPRTVSDARACRWGSAGLAIGGFAVTVIGGVVLYMFGTDARVYSLNGATAIGWIALAGGIVVAAASMARRPHKAAVALVVLLLAVNWIFVLRVLPDFERYKPIPAFAQTLAGRLGPDDAVAVYQVALPSLVYYLRRHVDEYFDEPSFRAALTAGRRTYAILPEEDYDALHPRLDGRVCVIDRGPVFNVKLGNVLARDPLPELLLITNECH